MNQNTLIIIAIIAIYGLSLYRHDKETFSNSGLNMSDRRCVEMTSWYNPSDNNHVNREDYKKRICYPIRRQIIDENTGNYFASHGAYNIPVNHFNSKYV
jgi:hypothetical protein